jgi:hypothetical protein
MELTMLPARVRHLVKIFVHSAQVSMDLSMRRVVGKRRRGGQE